jgi:hypothetical protein
LIDVEANLLFVCGIGAVVGMEIYFISWMISMNRVLSGAV